MSGNRTPFSKSPAKKSAKFSLGGKRWQNCLATETRLRLIGCSPVPAIHGWPNASGPVF